MASGSVNTHQNPPVYLKNQEINLKKKAFQIE